MIKNEGSFRIPHSEFRIEIKCRPAGISPFCAYAQNTWFPITVMTGRERIQLLLAVRGL